MTHEFSLSSDSDDDLVVSRDRNIEFIDQIIQSCVRPNFAAHPHQSMGPHVNGFANSSMIDTGYQQMSGRLILDSSDILNISHHDEYVWIKVKSNDQFQRALVAGTSEQRLVVSRRKHTHQYHYLFTQHQSRIVAW